MPVPPKPTASSRNRYQRGLLVWLQSPGDPAGLPEMRAALRTLASDFPGAASFWAAAGDFLRALSDGTLASDSAHRRLCGRIDQQIRACQSGSPGEATRQLGEELRQLLGPPQPPELPPEIAALNLSGQDSRPALDAEGLAAWRQAAREFVSAWHDLPGQPLRPPSLALCDAAIRLGLPEALSLAEALATTAGQVDDGASREAPVLRATLAAACELLGEGDTLGLPVFAQRVAHLVPRLESCQGAGNGLPPSLVQLFVGDVREKVGEMEAELQRLHPDGAWLAAEAEALAEHAWLLDLEAPAQAAEHLAETFLALAADHAFDDSVRRAGVLAELAELPALAAARLDSTAPA